MNRKTMLKDGSSIVHVYEKTTKEECSMCATIEGYCSHPDAAKMPWFNRMKGLAQQNLKRHLASGKHWKLVDYYYNPA